MTCCSPFDASAQTPDFASGSPITAKDRDKWKKVANLYKNHVPITKHAGLPNWFRDFFRGIMDSKRQRSETIRIWDQDKTRRWAEEAKLQSLAEYIANNDVNGDELSGFSVRNFTAIGLTLEMSRRLVTYIGALV